MKNRGFRNIGDRQKVAILVLVVAVHFLITFVYVTPDHYFPKSVNGFAAAYMMPVFHQAWDLFAPDPPLKEKSLQFRLYTGADWTPWIDPGRELLVRHDRCRLSNDNISFRLHQNAAFRLWQEVYRAEEVAKRRGTEFDSIQYIKDTRGYLTARYYSVQWYRKNLSNDEPDSVQMRLVIQTPPPFLMENLSWKLDTITLPIDDVRL